MSLHSPQKEVPLLGLPWTHRRGMLETVHSAQLEVPHALSPLSCSNEREGICGSHRGRTLDVDERLALWPLRVLRQPTRGIQPPLRGMSHGAARETRAYRLLGRLLNQNCGILTRERKNDERLQ